MSAQTVSEQTQNVVDKTAQFIALRCLLIIVVKTHPEKEKILEVYHDLMAHMSESMRVQAHPDAAQADPIFVQAAEGSAEVLAQIADAHAHLAEKLQEHAQQLLKDCQ